MKKIFVLLFLLPSLMSLHGQEVLNGSFEIRDLTPSPPLLYYFEMHACENWIMATYSSDWLSPEVGSHILDGYEPRTGTGHARFAGSGVHPGNAYKEMIGGQIVGLTAGEEYNVSFRKLKGLYLETMTHI